MNHVVRLDLVEVKDPFDGTPQFWLNIICWGTSFQLVGHVGTSKSAEAVWNTFARTWARVFGMPEIVVVDPGTEFQGMFADNIQNGGACLFPTDARAPRQNGRAERVGEEWKPQLRLADSLCIS